MLLLVKLQPEARSLWYVTPNKLSTKMPMAWNELFKGLKTSNGKIFIL